LQLLGFVRRKPIWYLVRVKERPRKEKAEETAARHLQEAGLDVYLPMMEDAPLCGGYLFAQLKDMEIIERSRSMSLPEFNVVRDEEIQRLRGICWDSVKDKTDPKGPGKPVFINSPDNPFNHMQAVVKAKKGDRIIVLMKIIEGQKDQELEFKLSEVEAA